MTTGNDMAANIREHMEVIGEDDRHVGTVDGVEGDMIKLTKSDPESGGKHLYLPLDLVSGIEGNQIRLMIPADQALLEADDDDMDEDGEMDEMDEDEEIDTSKDQPA